ncbi:hypothetical protein THTE_0170 [Thermogutta terrifontis]|uniref:Uncharacterized protein n=1 Tax=Thermogutta terrifontis TaxID=1331910 RepID=A0A286R9X9_9BACT|nr:hypothetical protein THTE_0170 [Thermogutta terrifontis]
MSTPVGAAAKFNPAGPACQVHFPSLDHPFRPPGSNCSVQLAIKP